MRAELYRKRGENIAGLITFADAKNRRQKFTERRRIIFRGMRDREAVKKRRGRCDLASSGGWCTSTRGWQPHPVLSGTRVKRNAFPGVYLTVPRYIRRMIDRHQCFSTNASFLIFPPRPTAFFLFLVSSFIVLSSRSSAF